MQHPIQQQQHCAKHCQPGRDNQELPIRSLYMTHQFVAGARRHLQRVQTQLLARSVAFHKLADDNNRIAHTHPIDHIIDIIDHPRHRGNAIAIVGDGYLHRCICVAYIDNKVLLDEVFG